MTNYQLKIQLPALRPNFHEFPGLLIKMSLKTANNCGNWHPFLEDFVKLLVPETSPILFLEYFILLIFSPFLEIILQHLKGGFKRKEL